MNQSSRSHAHFMRNNVLAVNVLSTQHEYISNAFASSKFSSEERFKIGKWTTLKTGAPILEDALVSFDCQIEEIQKVGTHSIFLCRVIAIRRSQQEESLVYFNRAYHQVGQLETA